MSAAGPGDPRARPATALTHGHAPALLIERITAQGWAAARAAARTTG
jgi:hypothetical protein